MAAVEAEQGLIDVFVNNAGYGHRGVLEEVALDDLRRQLVWGDPAALGRVVVDAADADETLRSTSWSGRPRSAWCATSSPRHRSVSVSWA